MLEWSSLYRVTLLLSKINDDSDLDAEAAILYGKVGRCRLLSLSAFAPSWLFLNIFFVCLFFFFFLSFTSFLVVRGPSF